MKAQTGNLTAMERDALILVARGLSNQEIARELSVSDSQVKSLVHHACGKLNARNRIEAVLFAMKKKIVDAEEIFSIDGLSELLASLGPNKLETVAQLLRKKTGASHVADLRRKEHDDHEKRSSILTRREKEVLSLVARGLTNQEIAARLFTTVSTVRTFLYQACLKLDAGNRAQAFISAIRSGALHVDEVFSLDEVAELLESLGPEGLGAVKKRLMRNSEQDCSPA